MDLCQTCGRPLPQQAGKRGRASVYCSAACRQKAYRSRQSPSNDSVHELIADIGRRVESLAPQQPGPFYADVTELSSSVSKLRRIARTAAEIITPEPVTETPSESDFAALIEPYRRELRVHCYRMLGSYDDAEDQVQETFLRAWRNRDSFEGRATFRAWLYRIATNACLDFLRRTNRRPQRYEPIPGMDHGSADPPDRITWLQPFPDVAVTEETPDEAVVSRETMELVFLAAIQHLPPRQRAVLILRDVLGWAAAETAELLDMTVASVNSALQRARPALRGHMPQRRLEWAASEPTEEEQAVLRSWMDAVDRDDFAAVAALLSEDVILTMPPNPFWFVGRDTLITFLKVALDPASPMYLGRWRHVITSANRMPAVANYVQRTGTNVYRAQVLDVLRIEGGLVREITSFEPHLFPAFGLPLTLSDR